MQAELDKLTDALKAARAAGDEKAEVKTLRDMGDLYFRSSSFEKAMEQFNQALVAAKSASDVIGQTAALNGIARCYRGEAQNQKALETFQKALDLATASGNETAQANNLNGIGNVYAYLGDKQKALDHFSQAIAINQKTGNRRGEAATLNNIAAAYSDLGDRRKALEYYSQSLTIQRDIKNPPGEATTLNDIGEAYSNLGEKKKALEYYSLALPIEREINAHAGEGVTLNGIGSVYVDLGEPQKALEYFNQALPIERQVNDRFDEASVLMNIGAVNSQLGDHQKALDYQNQALQIYRQLDFGLGQAKALNNIGVNYGSLGDYPKAIEYYKQAMLIFRQRNFPRGEANTLNNMGLVYTYLGYWRFALDSFNQALAPAALVGDPLLESQTFIYLMVVQNTSQPELAIFYGKQAVNLLQQVRGNIQGMDEEVQKSFMTSKGAYYRGLAEVLVAQGRLPEAEQVLDMEKQQEYSDYVRGEAVDKLSPLTLTPAEREAEEEYQKSTSALVSAGEQWTQLKKNTARTPEQDKQFEELSAQLSKAGKGLDVFYSRLYVLFGKTNSANNRVADVKGPVSELKHILAKMPNTVALYTLVGTDRTSIIVITGSADVPAVVRESAISEVDLNKKIAAFQQVLRHPGQDPKPLAQELYNLLIGPVKADLDQAKAKTLVWSLDGTLRYVPMAALYDGKQYLVEKYNTATISPASIAHLAEAPDMSNITTVAMGISLKFEEGLTALPAVVGELDNVVKDEKVQGANGALTGTILLNGQFTEKAMENQLGSQPTVVHIASHFVYNPGDAEKSYLLLAGGDHGSAAFHLTVEDFHHDANLSLSETALLTLSACDTGMSGSASDGKEVDGLGMTAEYKGAKAVISSLWSVNDSSTGQLMGDFYQRWAAGGGKLTKVEALRQAQLDLLLGKVRIQQDGGERGFVPDKPEDKSPAGFSHPFYWAPFVLMGNWR